MNWLKACLNHLILTPMNYNKVCSFRSNHIETLILFFEELENLNRKMTDQIRIGQTYDASQEECTITSSMSFHLSFFRSIQFKMI